MNAPQFCVVKIPQFIHSTFINSWPILSHTKSSFIKTIMSSPSSIQETVNTNHSTTISLFGTTMPFDVYSATYALLVAAGGIMGYVKAKSVPSLAAGLTFGALLGFGSYMEATRDNHYPTFATSGILGAMMAQRFLKSRKFMPSGLVAAMSIGMVLRYSIRTIQIAQESSGSKSN